MEKQIGKVQIIIYRDHLEMCKFKLPITPLKGFLAIDLSKEISLTSQRQYRYQRSPAMLVWTSKFFYELISCFFIVKARFTHPV